MPPATSSSQSPARPVHRACGHPHPMPGCPDADPTIPAGRYRPTPTSQRSRYLRRAGVFSGHGGLCRLLAFLFIHWAYQNPVASQCRKGVGVRVRGLQRRRRDGCHTPTWGLEARFDMFSHSPVCPVRPVVAGGRCDLFGEIPSGMLGNRKSARGQARLRLSIHAGKMVTERMSRLL